jgi:succinoglycan biosynthesis protein ExoM
MKRSLAICVATYQRPAGLRRLLESLETLDLPRGWRVEVRIVDNDPQASARELVGSFAACHPLLLRYSHLPTPNVAGARNRGLDLGRCDRVAFVDDDEVVAQDWLTQLMDTLERTQADAVFGTVERAVCGGAAWVTRGKFFADVRPAGRLDWRGARTGNALVRGEWFYARIFRFDESFGRTGGEDADLFARLSRAGAVFAGAPGARVTEVVEAKRLGLSYLVRRAWRQGLTVERIRAREGQGRHPLASLALRVASGGAGLVRGLPAAFLGDPGASARGVERLALAGGGAAGWLAPQAAIAAVGGYAA